MAVILHPISSRPGRTKDREEDPFPFIILLRIKAMKADIVHP